MSGSSWLMRSSVDPGMICRRAVVLADEADAADFALVRRLEDLADQPLDERRSVQLKKSPSLSKKSMSSAAPELMRQVRLRPEDEHRRPHSGPAGRKRDHVRGGSTPLRDETGRMASGPGASLPAKAGNFSAVRGRLRNVSLANLSSACERHMPDRSPSDAQKLAQASCWSKFIAVRKGGQRGLAEGPAAGMAGLLSHPGVPRPCRPCV